MSKIKLLFVSGSFTNGGVENVIISYCRSLDKSKYQIDIFANEVDWNSYNVNVALSMGINIFTLKQPLAGGYIRRNKIRAHEFIAVAKEYDIVHYNSTFAMSYLYCKALKKIKPKIKIIKHAHGSNVNGPFKLIKTIFHNVVKRMYRKVPDYYVACSHNAAKWMFAKSIIKRQQYLILYNTVNKSRCEFSESKRNAFRESENCKNQLIVGTIGRLSSEKNCGFIIKILSILKKRNIDFKFIWVGDGEEAKKIENSIEKNKLQNYIIRIPSTDDVQTVLSSMDLFLLPSKHEGLPIVLIEAQVAGLFCIASDKISDEVFITKNIVPVSVHSAKKWADSILQYSQTEIDRNHVGILNNAPFDNDKNIKLLERIYDA